jgi:hypothetical protein
MRRIFYAVLILALAGCASKTLKLGDINQGNWSARALIKDKEQSRSFIVNLNLNAVRHEKLRLDVSSTLGQQVAALTTTSTEVRYYTTEQKKFYVGAPKSDVLRPILAIPLDPRWLQNLLFDEAIVNKNWTCKLGEDHLIAECRNEADELTITWTKRRGDARTITIQHPKAELQISIRSFSPKIETAPGLFDLVPPNGYQKLKIR